MCHGYPGAEAVSVPRRCILQGNRQKLENLLVPSEHSNLRAYEYQEHAFGAKQRQNAGRSIYDHGPVFVAEFESGARIQDKQFCSYACLSVYIYEESLTEGAPCEINL